METSEPHSLKIRVEVQTSYVEEQSDPRDKRFVFSYTITIRNEGKVPARLMTRHWIITDANGNVTASSANSRTSSRARDFVTPAAPSSKHPWAPCREAIKWWPTTANNSTPPSLHSGWPCRGYCTEVRR